MLRDHEEGATKALELVRNCALFDLKLTILAYE